MSSLTVGDLDESLKSRLRVRAARLGRSMAEEVRQILRAALAEHEAPVADMATRVRRRFAPLGDVQLPAAVPARMVTRNLSDFEACGLTLIDPWRVNARR